MPLTLPNLDDRSYADLVEEARGLLVTYAPALTNHNPSDPVVTIIEMFAYFTEILLFRLNLVTDANRAAFLRLLNGPDWPAPATHEQVDADVRATVLKARSVERAVTPADFEFLARSADAEERIARAHCVPQLNLELDDPGLRHLQRPGHVSVVIVPFAGTDLASLTALVADYLEPRRLLGTRVHVVGPRYVPLSVRATLRLLPDAIEGVVRELAVEALMAYFDPVAGRDGTGWPFGRDVHASEIYRLLDGLAGVDFVRLDAIETTEAFADRSIRNSAGELIGIDLKPEELVAAHIAAADIRIERPLSVA